MNGMFIKLLMPVAMHLVDKMITKKVITPENFQKYGKKLFDSVDEFIIDTETKVDDTLVLPISRAARKSAGIKL